MATTPKREIRAEHSYLDRSGAVVDDEEAAVGCRYKDLATGGTIDWLAPDGVDAGSETALIYIFGLKTLMTNEASQARQGGLDGKEQLAGISDRLNFIRSGQGWVDRTREGGPKLDLDTLSQALANVMVNDGTATAESISNGGLVKIRAKLDDSAFFKFAKAANGVMAEYNRLRGKDTKSVADLAAMAGL